MKRRLRHPDLLRQAVAHHTAGRSGAAEALYRRVEAEDPQNPDALNLLGVLAAERAQYDQAKAFYLRAAAAAPGVADIHFNLANLLHATGDSEGAISSYKRAIALRPAFAGAHTGLGVEFYARGQFKAAVACFREAVRHAPRDMHGHVNLGQCLLELRRAHEAIAPLTAAADLAPADAGVQLLLSNAYAATDRLQDALLHIRRAIALAPAPEFSSTLGDLLRRAGDFDGALAAHETAMVQKPDDPAILYNAAASLHAAGRLAEAEARFKRALIIAPGFVKAHIGLAKVYEHRGLFAPAVETLQAAAALDPASADIRFKLSVLQLAAGDFREGWANYAHRMADSNASHPPRAMPPPYWSGEDLAGKCILVWTEQGIGDEILYGGILPDVVARARHCVIECSPRMAPVFARSFPGATVAAYQKPEIAVTRPEGIDYQIAVGDLGRFLRTGFPDFQPHHGYLKADSTRTESLRARYRALAPGHLVVGLSWRSGNKEVGALKSAVLADWGALLTIPRVTFVNLQYGDCAEELAAARARLGTEVFADPEIDPLKDMDNFFAQVAAMDLVISTSNTTAHVAGSLNVPVWLLDAGGPGALWYWFRDRADSPWYPAMRIFRPRFQEIKISGKPWWEIAVQGPARRLAAGKAL